MMRKILVVGDPPAPGGRVLPYDGPMFDLYGHRAALIGGRAYCEGCNSVGIIAKAGGLRRALFISEVALEGDVVVCHCPVPQPLVSVLQQTATYDDDDAYALGTTTTAAALATSALTTASVEMAAFKKTVDAAITHPPEAEQTENICPNMTNKEFAALALKVRDMAVDCITTKRLPQLERWDKEAQALVRTWFAVADQRTREHLQKGLAACVRVLRSLEARNFVRFLEGGKLATCVMGSALGTDAAACKQDTATHTIAIGLPFCGYSINQLNFDTGEAVDGNSQLLVLIHEVTHFDDTFSSNDTWYGTVNSRRHVKKENHAALLTNADSIGAYILGIR